MLKISAICRLTKLSLSIVLLLGTGAVAQTRTFCAQETNCTWAGTNTYNGAVTFTSGVTATGAIGAANISWATPLDYGAKGDVVTLTDVNITTGTKIVTSAAALFNCATDVGKYMTIPGAGTSAARALVSPIASCQSTSQVTLTDNAGTTVSNATFPTLAYYGTNDRAAVNSCAQAAFAVGGNCYINDNKTFMVSGTGTTISFGALPGVKGGMISGGGTIVYAPYGTLTAGVNDRLFYFQSGRTTPCQIAAGAIAKGATSITVSVAGCVSAWKKGDSVIVHEKDAGIGDFVYVDWGTVSSISGTTVNLIAPLGTAFPNARAFNISGAPAGCVASQPCGLSVEKIGNIIQDLSLFNFGIIIPSITDGTNLAVGIVTTATKRTIIRGLTCQNASQNCFAGYLDLSLSFENNAITSAVQNEFATMTSPNISGNQFNTETFYGQLFNYTIQTGGGMNVDLGTSFASVADNVFGSANSSVCFAVFYGVHDSTFIGNSCKFGTTAAPAINVIGGYNNVVNDNILGGSVGGSTGIQFADTTTGTVNINSDKNQAVGNKIDSTYATPYSLPGTNNTDVAIDTGGQVSSGVITMYKFGSNWSFGGSQATNFLIGDSVGPKVMFHNSINQENLSTAWGYCIGSTLSAAPGGDSCISRSSAGVLQFGTAPANASGSFLATGGTFSGSVVPSTAGGIANGTNALPWSSVYIGNAATNNIQLTGTATTAKVATLPNNTGTVAELNLAQTWSANQSFNSGTLLPTAAGGTDLASTALPFGNLWLGTAATNNFKFQPASTTGARIITVADPLSPTTVGLPLLIASGTSTLTANAALGATTAQAAITTAGTGILTTDSIEWSYASAPSAGDAFCIVSAYATAGNVNFVRTNPTAGAQNVSAIVINWRVIR